ncbi:MAG: TonB family protein [Deltaproteobacteria bacterium]|nr:TonB family protein [Deltaproteobacteria bacterium]
MSTIRPDSMKKPRRDSGSSQVWLGLALSLLLHVLLGLWLWNMERPEETRADLVSLKLLDKKPPTALRLRKSKTPLKGQVVDLPKPVKEEVPKEARFLSQYDTRVEKEQKTRHRGRKNREAARARKAPSKKATTPARPGRRQKEADKVEAVPKRETETPTGLKGLAGLNRLLMPTIGGTPGASAMAAGGRGMFMSDDAMLGVREEGDTTLLNSRSFKYWDFFQRVKDRVREEWEPGPVYRSRDPYGKIYGQKDRLTVLSVTLDAKGMVQRMEVTRESGLPFLDKEAMASFRKASPFPNPPGGLADERGRISFSFGFLLDLSSSKSRFFWRRPQ